MRRRLVGGLAAICLLALLCVADDISSAAADSDVTAPSLVSLSWTPTTVDTSSTAQTITVTARITDDLAGNAGPGYSSSPSQARFMSPSRGQFVDALLDGTHRVSGTALDGIYQYTITIPAHAESETWTLDSLMLVDQVGNMRRLSTAELAAAGHPTTFTVTGTSDVTAPSLVSLSWTPTTVDTSSTAQTITVTARITDDLAGNAGPGYSSSPSQARFMSPSRGQFVDALLDGTHRVSGTALDGIYQYTITIPAHAESETWTLDSLMLVDQVGNMRRLSTAELAAAGHPTTFTVTGTSDVTAPSLVSLSWTPTTVDTSSTAQTITVTARITDDLAGNAGPGYSSSPSQARFMSPSRGQFVDALLDGTHRVSGTALDGIYQYTITIPAHAESETWTLDSLMLVDQVGNMRRLSTAELAAAGHPTTFTVTGTSDVTAPVITPSIAGALSNGWYSGDVVVTWFVSDPESRVDAQASCGTTTISNDTPAAGTTLSCNATSAGGTSTRSVTVRRDSVPPVLRRGPEVCSAPGSNGWCRGVMSAAFQAEDALSGLRDPGQTLFSLSSSANGSSVLIASGAVCDIAGNCTPSIDSGPFRIDAIPPTVAVTGVTATTYVFGSFPSAGCQSEDLGGSGIATPAIARTATTDALGVGQFTVTCAGAVDAAGNRADPVSVSFAVMYRFDGFYAVGAKPSSLTSFRMTAGFPGLFAWTVRNSNGSPVINPAAVRSVVLRPATGPVRVIPTYLSLGSFWAAIPTERAWAGTSATMVVTLADSSVHTAVISFAAAR